MHARLERGFQSLFVILEVVHLSELIKVVGGLNFPMSPLNSLQYVFLSSGNLMFGFFKVHGSFLQYIVYHLVNFFHCIDIAYHYSIGTDYVYLCFFSFIIFMKVLKLQVVTNSGRASTLVATDAAAPPLRRIEREAIAAATPITYPPKYNV